jgi:hypothetical protein
MRKRFWQVNKHSAEQMKNAGLDEKLFDKFLEMLESKGIKPQGGTLVDGTFVEVPRQHNTRAENEQIKNGEVPKSFEANKHKLAQKDCDASWTKKNDETYFGYKDHPWVDAFWKLIWGYAVTTAKVHDSVPYLDVLPEHPRPGCEGAYSDSAYITAQIPSSLPITTRQNFALAKPILRNVSSFIRIFCSPKICSMRQRTFLFVRLLAFCSSVNG